MATPLERFTEFRDAALAAAFDTVESEKRAALLQAANSWNEVIRAVKREGVAWHGPRER